MKHMKKVLAVLLGLALVLSFTGAVAAEENAKENSVKVEMDKLESGFVVEIPDTIKLSNKKGEWLAAGFLNVTLQQSLFDQGCYVGFLVSSNEYVSETDENGYTVERWVVKSESGKTVKYGILRGFHRTEQDANEYGYIIDEFGYETPDENFVSELLNMNKDKNMGHYTICAEDEASESLKLWTYPYEDPKSFEAYSGMLTFEFWVVVTETE